MTSQNDKDVPFDIANYRIVVCDRSLIGRKKLAADLGKAIDELLAALEKELAGVAENGGADAALFEAAVLLND